MSSRNSKKTEDSLSFDSTLSNHNVMNYVQGPFYSELSPGLRMSREKSSYANFLVNTAKYDKETVKNIAKDTTIHEIKRLYKRKEFEGASIDPAKNGNGVLSNIVTASMFDHLPQNQDDLEDYFLDLQKNDPERFKREYQSFCDVFSSVVEGVDEGEKYSLLMGGLAPQQEVEERKKDRYERKKEKPGWFRRQIRAHPKAAVASFLGVGGLVVATPFIAPLVNNYISNNSNNNSNNNNGVVVTGTDSDGDGLTDIEEETIYHTDPDNPDSDTDFILDGLEVNKYKTNPNEIDSDHGGVDDFNEIFTYPHYGLDPNNTEDDKEFIKKIPNVTVRNWNSEDGGISNSNKIIDISLRDPLLKYLADNSEIKWGYRDGVKIGTIFVNGEKIFNNWETPKDNYSNQPSYFLTNKRNGICRESQLTNNIILNLMGYEVKKVGGNNSRNSHSWNEAVIDNEVKVVDYNNIYPREGFYEKNGWTINSSDYTPNWFETN